MCKVPGCFKSHAKHNCKNCGIYDSDHFSSNCSGGGGGHVVSLILPNCPHGLACYHNNRKHFQECFHPPGYYSSANVTSRIQPCPYGITCYRKNPTHFMNWSHYLVHSKS